MPPKKRAREYYARQATTTASTGPPPEVVAKRTKRHLDELERSNYAETTLLGADEDGEEPNTGRNTKGRARQAICDRRALKIRGNTAAAKRKKSIMDVRTALIYRKSLATYIDEATIGGKLPASVPNYLTASAPPSPYPARLLCSVCGYWGVYKCRRCAMPYCDHNCEGVHNETRCERRVM